MIYLSRNTILIIGDGMGPEQVKAASLFKSGSEGSLFFESLPYQTQMTTRSKINPVTDSAASATAMATGTKVFNKTLSLTEFGRELPTILEIAKARGKMTGLVTSCYITHATPAAFASHVRKRKMDAEIADQYMKRTRPEVLLGGTSENLSPETGEAAGYRTVTNRDELLETTDDGMLLGCFGEGHMPYMYDEEIGDLPELSDMALKALDVLEEDKDGFFLMIEGGRIDHAGHTNNLERNIHETLELDDTVEQVLAWAEGREDTIIIVTADHECGGLSVLKNNGAGEYPDVNWRRDYPYGNTRACVPLGQPCRRAV